MFLDWGCFWTGGVFGLGRGEVATVCSLCATLVEPAPPIRRSQNGQRAYFCFLGSLTLLFRPPRIIRVTTEEELDSALASADQVIVEGDDRLLSYAATKASGDPENHVAVEVGGRSISVGGTGDRTTVQARSYPAPPSPVIAPTGLAEASALAPRGGPPRRTMVIIVVLLFALFSGLGGYFGLGTRWFVPSSPDTAQPSPAPPPADGRISGGLAAPLPPSPVPSPSNTVSPSTNVSMVLQTLSWPAVAIIAIAALFFIARQAIKGGRNVEISWKVTEKLAGRVVITKVRTPSRKVRSGA
jgi:hypothetical protein